MVASPVLFSSISRNTSIHQRLFHVHVGRLIHPVYPVGIEDLTVGSPILERRFGLVALGKVVEGAVDGDAPRLVAEILLRDVAPVVFGVPLHVYLTAFASYDEMRADFLVLDKYLKILFAFEVFTFHPTPTRMRDEHFVVHAREERRLGFVMNLVKKDAELFLLVCVRPDAVLMIQLRVRRPAAENGGGHMPARPIEKLRELFPVVHIFKCAVLEVGAGNDEAVEAALFHLCDSAVKGVKVVLFRVRFVSVEIYERGSDLERRVPEQAQKLYFSALHYRARHEIQYSDFERSDILVFGALGRYLGDLLALQIRERRELLVDDECHNLFFESITVSFGRYCAMLALRNIVRFSEAAALEQPILCDVCATIEQWPT